MDRLLDFLLLNPSNDATLCRAGEKYFCRLGVTNRWKLSEKDWPLDYNKDSRFCCCGYSDSYEEAINAAFLLLPG